jgi:hypothetical protein
MFGIRMEERNFDEESVKDFISVVVLNLSVGAIFKSRMLLFDASIFNDFAPS